MSYLKVIVSDLAEKLTYHVLQYVDSIPLALHSAVRNDETLNMVV